MVGRPGRVAYGTPFPGKEPRVLPALVLRLFADVQQIPGAEFHSDHNRLLPSLVGNIRVVGHRQKDL